MSNELPDFADHGYVVVSIDGRGTPNRGRAWQRAVKGDLIEIPLADQASALRRLGENYRELDLSRVGIYGWSFGGYFSAMAVMREGNLFRAGVAGAPVVDWRDYDTHYTERYMDLPGNNPDGYDAAKQTRPHVISVPCTISTGLPLHRKRQKLFFRKWLTDEFVHRVNACHSRSGR